MTDNGQDGKPKRKQRQSGGFAVGMEVENGTDVALTLLCRNLLDTADAEKWICEHGEASASYAIIQIKRSGIRVEVTEVRQAKLV